MFAVIKLHGAQYMLQEGQIFSVNKMDVTVGEEIAISDGILCISHEGKLDFTTEAGSPVVTLKVLEQTRDKKIIIFKKRRRKHSKRKNGHRQYITKLEVISIVR